MTKPFNIGRDGKIVFLWNGTRIDLPSVTQFQSQQTTNIVASTPLNSKPKSYNIPNGWSGSFMVQRDSATLDTLVNNIESAFWTSGTITNGTLYFYVTEPDGTTSTWEFTDVTIRLDAAGTWRNDDLVTQSVAFIASQRTKIS